MSCWPIPTPEALWTPLFQRASLISPVRSLCAPVQTNISYLPFLKEIIQPGCTLTDVGSVKGEMEAAVEAAGLSPYFIGGHPMAGSEKTGFASSTDYLLENAYYVVAPSPRAELSAVSAYVDLVSSLGAIPLVRPAKSTTTWLPASAICRTSSPPAW